MDTKAGYFTNTNTMYQSLFGLDEVFWLVEQDEDRNAQNELDVGLSKIDTEIHSNDHVLRSTFEGSESLFDDEWMNTKIDFSSGDVSLVSSYQSVADITETPDVMETTIEVVNPPQRISCRSTSDSTSTSETMDVSPTSPEQHVPNVEISSDGQQIKDVIESILLNGTPSPELTEPCFFPDAMENIMEVNKSCLITKMTAEVGVISHCPQPNLKGKPRTSEQKQRKRLQNRNAATRYRCKKRSQQEALNNQCSELEEENQTLRKKIKSLEQETDYLKNLIADVFQKKADKKIEQKSKEIHA